MVWWPKAPLYSSIYQTGWLWDMFTKEQIRSGGGVTLIELMVAMAVVAIATFARIKL